MDKLLIILFFLASGTICSSGSTFAQAGKFSNPAKWYGKTGAEGLPPYMDQRIDSMLGTLFPAFEVKNGGKVSFGSKDLRNKIVFVNFWFEACKPCMQEMNALNKLYDTLKNDRDFMFLSFTFDNKEASARVKEKFGIKYPVHRISEEESRRLNGGNGYPTSFFLDKNGVIRWVGFASIEKEIGTGELVHSIYPRIL